MQLAVLFSALNTALLIGLLFIYGRIAWRSKAFYSYGLLIFAFLLLLQNALTVFSYITMTQFFLAESFPFLFGISLLEFGGLLVLLRITI